MPPKRFEGKFGIPSSHAVDSLLTQALYRLPESITPEFIKGLVEDIVASVDLQRRWGGDGGLNEAERQTLALKLARHYEENGESEPIDKATLVDALVESPRFLESDKGSIAKLFEIHEMKTLQKIAELRRKRTEITERGEGGLNPYENLFGTGDGKYYLARLLNMPHLEDESTYMNHCVGTSTSYISKMKRGEVEIFSLRDTKTHEPVITIEYDAKVHRLLQVKGKLDRIPTLSDMFAPSLLEALRRLPETVNDNGEHRTVTSNEVVHLTRLLELQDKVTSRTELTRDDLLFLYEINEPIVGFDEDEREPLIATLQAQRDRKADIVTMANCAPEHLTTTFTNLNEQIEVICKDTEEKITFIDFREERYKAKLPQLIELAQKLKEFGSPAIVEPDLSFEGGIVSLTISGEVLEQLKNLRTACIAYEQADNNSPSWVYHGLEQIPWKKPTIPMLDVLVLTQGRTTPQERDILVTHMDTLGYRPITLAELIAIGITRPDLNKRNETLNTLEKHSLNGNVRSPYFEWDGHIRYLDAFVALSVWDERSRFLFLRK